MPIPRNKRINQKQGKKIKNRNYSEL